MKRLTAALATVSLALTVTAPIASAKYQPAKALNKGQQVHVAKKMPGKAQQVRITKHIRGF